MTNRTDRTRWADLAHLLALEGSAATGWAALTRQSPAVMLTGAAVMVVALVLVVVVCAVRDGRTAEWEAQRRRRRLPRRHPAALTQAQVTR